MYGCGNQKLASTLGKPKTTGGKLKAQFWNTNKPLQLLIDDLERSLRAHKGWIKGLDGRKVFIREERKLLNSLLQASAAVVFKRWMVKVDEWLQCFYPDVKQVIAYHDELQFEIPKSYTKDDVDTIGAAICLIAKQTGEEMKINVPIEAEYKIGTNWAETH